MGLADRIFLMRTGRLVQAGTPEALYRQPVDAAAARFFSEANEITGHVVGQSVDTPLGRFATPPGFTGLEALVMVRPQAFAVAANGIEGYVIDNDLLGAILRTVKGIEVTPDTLSFEVIRRNLERAWLDSTLELKRTWSALRPKV